MSIVVALGSVLSLLLAADLPAGAGDASVRSYAFASDVRPVTVVVKVAYAEIEIVGSAREDVLLRTEPITPSAGAGAVPEAVPTTHLVPVIDGNTLRIESPRNTQPLRIRMEVPRNLALEVWGSNGGRIVVRRVVGPLSIENSNAGVTLDHVSGSAVVYSSNGSIVGRFESVTPETPMSFVTSNGAIDLAFPSDLRADVILETDNAGFRSEFTIEPELGDHRPLPPGRRRATGRINGGGPLVRMATENGEIRLRREPSPE